MIKRRRQLFKLFVVKTNIQVPQHANLRCHERRMPRQRSAAPRRVHPDVCGVRLVASAAQPLV
eukprot:6208204-Pleurochrysis_carterae.AAC.4